MGHDQTKSGLSNPPPTGSAGEVAPATAGFAELTPVAAAWAWLDALARATATETVKLQAACGRVLAEATTIDPPPPLPPRAAANGYAVRASACDGASSYNPLSLTLLPSGSGVLPPRAACPVASGWLLPTGADAVLPLAAAQPAGNGWLEVLDAVPPGAGIEIPPPALPLPAGRRLQPQDIGCLAASGARRVAVQCQPRVALLVPGAKAGPDMLTPMLAALLARDAATVATIKLAATEPAALLAALSGPALDACDLVLLAGRAGVGFDDIAAAQVQAAGGSLVLHGLALRPGGNAGLATLPRQGGTLPVLLLPGEPFGCFAAYDLLAARLVRRLAGLPAALPYPVVECPLSRKLVSGLGSMDVVAVRLVDGGAEPVAAEAGLAGAALADGFVLVAEGSEGYPAGTRVPVHLFRRSIQGSMA